MPYYGDGSNLTGVVDTDSRDDIALLGFKVASNGSLAKYNLVDQTVDAFEDASGVNAGSSTNALRNDTDNYYSGGADTNATGGTITSYDSGDTTYTVHSFLSGTTVFTPPSSANVSILLVGAGGGGAWGAGGGGGAGGVLATVSQAVTAQDYDIIIGTGGAGTTGTGGGFGPDTTGGTGVATSGLGLSVNGGAGGNGKANVPGRGNGGTSGTPTAFAGGSGAAAPSSDDGGGGGGASAVGQNGGPSGGNGGSGLANDYRTGSDVTYGGGGGGAAHNSPMGSGGSGGGGAGGSAPAGGGAGSPNTGGGGGGVDFSASTYAGAGGTGIAVIRYPDDTFQSSGSNLTLISNTTAAEAAPTKGDVVFTYTNGAGTTTLGTDVTAEISADGGSTWTAMTLGSEGSTGSHNIATSHDVTISSTITAPWNMAYRIKTLNQSASKTTRIQAISLGWS